MCMSSWALFGGSGNRRRAKDVLSREVRVVDRCAGGETRAREREGLLRLVMII